jgi:hypothetical protein
VGAPRRDSVHAPGDDDSVVGDDVVVGNRGGGGFDGSGPAHRMQSEKLRSRCSSRATRASKQLANVDDVDAGAEKDGAKKRDDGAWSVCIH